MSSFEEIGLCCSLSDMILYQKHSNQTSSSSSTSSSKPSKHRRSHSFANLPNWRTKAVEMRFDFSRKFIRPTTDPVVLEAIHKINQESNRFQSDVWANVPLFGDEDDFETKRRRMISYLKHRISKK
eukprot:c11524_g1_i1.p1 GENE.c11524_g1_i1~~c11524_g1_i1.p1  ORF type:complete len:139 (+),score=45.11 c11524_g1_i1:40-417(+)